MPLVYLKSSDFTHKKIFQKGFTITLGILRINDLSWVDVKPHESYTNVLGIGMYITFGLKSIVLGGINLIKRTFWMMCMSFGLKSAVFKVKIDCQVQKGLI